MNRIISLQLLSFVLLVHGQNPTCDEEKEMTTTELNISRDRKPGGQTTCTIKITAPKDMQLELNITDLKSMAGGGPNICTDNYIAFANDHAGLATATPYCDNTPAPVFTSSKNELYLLYHMDTNQYRRFAGYVIMFDPNSACGKFPSNFDGTEQTFQFPAAEHQWNRPAECTYAITSMKGKKIKATIHHIRLGTDASCAEDYVLLTNTADFSGSSVFKKCGSTVPDSSFITEKNKLYMKVKVKNYQINPYLSMIIGSDNTDSKLPGISVAKSPWFIFIGMSVTSTMILV